MRVSQLAMMIGLVAAWAVGGTQYWDTSTAAGYQHGNGLWSDSRWTTNGTTLQSWVDGESAAFSAANGSSIITMDGQNVTCGSLSMYRRDYTLVVTNGGSLTVTNTTGLTLMISYGSNAGGYNHVSVIGGEGITSRCTTPSTRIEKGGGRSTVMIDGMGYDGSAVFSCAGTFDVGYALGACPYNEVIVRRGGHFQTATLSVGRANIRNSLIIQDGGYFQGSPVNIGINSGGDYNTLEITGPDSRARIATLVVGSGGNRTGNKVIVANGGVLTNVTTLSFGSPAFHSGISVTNGGKVFSSGAVTVGPGASIACTGLVSGAQSRWTLGNGNLMIGSATAVSNVFLVVDAATVTNVNALTVHPNNSLNLLGGTISAATVTLNVGSVTVVGIAGAAGPGAGWGQLATSGSHALGGTLKPVLLSGFEPSGETAFVIMKNTGANISGTFGNAGDGDTIPAYGEDLVTPVGEFTVAISATAVTLHFVAPPGGTLLLVR